MAKKLSSDKYVQPRVPPPIPPEERHAPNEEDVDHSIPPPDAPKSLNRYARFVVADDDLTVTPAKSHTCFWGTPPKSAFVRVHPDPSMRLNLRTYVDETGTKKKTYLVDPGMKENYRLQGQLKTVKVFPYITHHLPPKLGIWPVSIGHAENTWVRSACRIVLELEQHWLMVVADTERGEYLTKPPEVAFPEPDWSALPANVTDWLDMAFTEADWITPENWADHPVHKKLAGLARR